MIVGWVEAMTGFGLIVGPIIGSGLYSLFGFKHTFFVYGGFLVILALVIKVNFPTDEGDGDRLKEIKTPLLEVEGCEKTSEVEFVQVDDIMEGDYQMSAHGSVVNKVTLWTLLMRSRFTLAALSSALCYFNYSFMEPILAQRLSDMRLNTMDIGLFFAIWPVFYIPAAIAVQYVPQYVDKRVTIIISALMSSVAFVFVGPSQLLAFPDSLTLMIIGQAVLGIFTATMMIPGLPEMVESTLPHFPG